MKEFTHLIKDIVSLAVNSADFPLPDARKEALLRQRALKILTPQETEKTLSLLVAELEKTRGYGHKIRRKDFEKEANVVVFFLDLMGGPAKLKESGDYYGVQETLGEALSENLEKELEHYFKETPWGVGYSRNWYRSHLEAVRTAVVRQIFNKEIYTS